MPKKVTDEGIRHYLQVLTATPGRILACVNGLDEARLRQPPGAGEWLVVDIMAHIRGCCDVWSYSIYAMLTLDKPQLAYIHPREWTQKLGYAALSFADNFEAYRIGRANLLRILGGLSFEDWNRSATFIGKANVYTIFGETLRMAEHDLDHSQQLEAMFPPG